MKPLMNIVTFLFLVVVSMVAVACGPGNQANQQTPTSPSSASASQMTVNIVTDQSGLFGFSPKTLTIPVGTTVT